MLAMTLAALLPTTWIVDLNNGPGTDFTDLPTAVATAQDGDTLIIRSGNYPSGFSVSGKALTLRGGGADLGSGTRIYGSVFISDTPPGAQFVLSGLSVSVDGGLYSPGGRDALTIDNASVVALDCGFYGDHLSSRWLPAFALELLNDAHMHARNCVFRGGDGLTAVVVLFSAGDGVLVEAGSSLHADRCDFSGGNDSTGLGFVESGYALRSGGDVGLFQCTCRGGGPVPGVAGAGADAVIADGGTMRISGDAAAVIQGGTAVTGASASDAAWSGLAIRVNGGSVAVHDSVSLLPATVGAVVTAGPVSTGNAALPFFSADGTTLPSGETDAASPVVMTLQSGLPNQPYAFVVGFRAARTSDPALLGDLWIDLSSSAMLFGALDATGSFSIGFTPEDLFGGLYGFPFFAQVAVLDGALNIRMSNCDARIYDL